MAPRQVPGNEQTPRPGTGLGVCRPPVLGPLRSMSMVNTVNCRIGALSFQLVAAKSPSRKPVSGMLPASSFVSWIGSTTEAARVSLVLALLVHAEAFPAAAPYAEDAQNSRHDRG
jgi:hypothetical protein